MKSSISGHLSASLLEGSAAPAGWRWIS